MKSLLFIFIFSVFASDELYIKNLDGSLQFYSLDRCYICTFQNEFMLDIENTDKFISFKIITENRKYYQ